MRLVSLRLDRNYYNSPIQYFDFNGSDVLIVDCINDLEPDDIVILQGTVSDDIINRLNGHYKLIGWSISQNIVNDLTIYDYTKQLISSPFLIMGIREFGLSVKWVPDCSCMNMVFDNIPKPKTSVVFYQDINNPILKPSGLILDNTEESISRTIEFLAQGETVITNDYYGMYWASLIGRKVIAIPTGSNFFGFKYSPTYCIQGDWWNCLKDLRNYPEALQDCRAINNGFYRRVLGELQ